jgi:enoyl-CoA hydratase
MADYSKYQEVKVERDGPLLTVTFDRPEVRNSISWEMHDELDLLWHEVGLDQEVGAIIITGSGDRAFSSGGNVKNMQKRTSAGPDWRGSFLGPKRLIGNLLEIEQPIVAAVNGDAIGLGASIAFACDIIVANEKARFADTHVKVGLVAGDGGTLLWPMMMSIHKAKEYLMTGDFLLAKDAERLGIINYALPYEEVMPKAREIALRLANGPKWAIRWTKGAVNKILRERHNLIMDTSLATEYLTLMTDDHREAAAAWAERRQPHYTGR